MANANNWYPDNDRVGDIRRFIEQEVASRLDGAMKVMEERFQQMEERGTVGPRDVRMSCLHLAKDATPNGAPCEKIIQAAESFTIYVLTGKKPGEARDG